MHPRLRVLLAGLGFAVAAYVAPGPLFNVVVGTAHAQPGPGGPPAVGVVQVRTQAITETSEFVGRIQAVDRVDLTARVTAVVQERLFAEGTEVKVGDLLYRLERGPFEAAVQQAAAAVAQFNATLNNASITLQRATSLLNTPAGQRSTVDDARAQQLSVAAQVAGAQAQLRTAQINLDYTEIRAPIAGKIGQTRFSVGNVVSPSAGPLDTIVSQDPMYVLFPIAVRAQLELAKRYEGRGGMNAVVVKLRLPDGTMYGQDGKIDFVDPSVSANTDTIAVRAKIPNPPRGQPQPGQPVDRQLTDGEFVTVNVEGIEPVQAPAIPRAAVLSDQQGSYVFVVDSQNRAQQRRIQLGQSTPTVAVVTAGLKDGETVVVDGLQRVRPNQPVTPGPASPGPTAPPGTGPAGAGAASGAGASGGPAGAAASSPSTATPASGAPAGGASGASGGGAGTSKGQ
jgi:membrane fusion protein (multidrug efflux system)